MSVVLSVAEVGPCERELKVEVPVPAVEAETAKVVAEFQRRVRLPGFRKGKAPAKLVHQRFREDIDREILDRLVPRFWREARTEAGLEPVLPPRVHGVEMEPGTPMTFVARVEVRPPVELTDLGAFDLPRPPLEPTGEEVDRAVEELRRRHGTWSGAERPAARGDRVRAEVTELGEGEEGGGEPRPAAFEVGAPGVWEELSAAVEGLAPGGGAEFVRRDEERERRFAVTLREVEELEPAPLDDALAARLGAADVAALRQRVESELRRAKEREARALREGALLKQLCERHPVPLPPGLVERQVRRLVEDYAAELDRQGVDLARSTIDWQGVADQARPQAERQVHARLLLDAVADAEAVAVEASEVEAAVAALARAQGRPTPAVRQALAEAGKLEDLEAQLRREKALRRLLGEGPAAGGEPEAG